MFVFFVQSKFSLHKSNRKQKVFIELLLIDSDHAKESSNSFRISSFVTGQPPYLDIRTSCRARCSKHDYVFNDIL